MADENKFEFSLSGYASLLTTAQWNQYEFISFGDVGEESGKVCLLRHDVDADPYAALLLAREEAKLGVKSTYFFMNRSPVYNVYSRCNHRVVQEIVNLGHWVGLHYDEGFFPDGRYTTVQWIDMEVDYMNSHFGVNIEAVSFHQPSEKVLDGEVRLSRYINTYDSDKLSEYSYLSDSNKTWKGDPPWKVFEAGRIEKLHLLVHPMWWVNGSSGDSCSVVWNNTIIRNFERMQEQLLDTERAYGGERRFSLKENG